MQNKYFFLVYISHYTSGLKILDVYDPSYPVEVAAYDTYPNDDDDGFYGCWGAYPFTSNGYVYASDMQYGLYILDFDEGVVPYYSAAYLGLGWIKLYQAK